jgi:hypothetical protein
MSTKTGLWDPQGWTCASWPAFPSVEEGVEAEVACQEGKAVERDRVELRLIGNRLLDRVPFRVVAKLGFLKGKGCGG